MSRNVEYWRWARRNLPYFKSDKCREANRKRALNYAQRNKAKNNCRHILQYAVKAGNVIRPNYCTRCGIIGRPEAHHEDYFKPLEVDWLCKLCHAIAEKVGEK